MLCGLAENPHGDFGQHFFKDSWSKGGADLLFLGGKLKFPSKCFARFQQLVPTLNLNLELQTKSFMALV